MSDTPETSEAIEASKRYYFRWWPETVQPIKGVTSHTPLEIKCMQLERERNKLRDIIRRAKTAFFEDGPDGTICVNMLEILKEAKE
jgi:hypothetical protein